MRLSLPASWSEAASASEQSHGCPGLEIRGTASEQASHCPCSVEIDIDTVQILYVCTSCLRKSRRVGRVCVRTTPGPPRRRSCCLPHVLSFAASYSVGQHESTRGRPYVLYIVPPACFFLHRNVLEPSSEPVHRKPSIPQELTGPKSRTPRFPFCLSRRDRQRGSLVPCPAALPP